MCDSGRPHSATDLGSQDEMDGRRVLGGGAEVGLGGMGGKMDCEGVKRFMGLSVSVTPSMEEWEEWES